MGGADLTPPARRPSAVTLLDPFDELIHVALFSACPPPPPSSVSDVFASMFVDVVLLLGDVSGGARGSVSASKTL